MISRAQKRARKLRCGGGGAAAALRALRKPGLAPGLQERGQQRPMRGD